MEETQAAPPADAPETLDATAEPEGAASVETQSDEAGGPTLAADFSNIDAVIEAARLAVEAEAGIEAPASDVKLDAPAPSPDDTEADEVEPEPESDDGGDDEEARALEALSKRGYKVEPPPPPPDPFGSLVQQLAPLVGTAEQYTQAKARAMAEVPTAPDLYAPDYDQRLALREQVLADKDRAARELARYDLSRAVTDVAVPWARQRVLGELGAALEQIPARYGLDAAQAKRVTEPTTMTDSYAAVAEAIAKTWQKRLDEQDTRHKAELARARADGRAARVTGMGRAPSPGSPAGGRPGGAFSGLYGPDGLPTEEAIARAKRGELAGLDLG